MKKAVVVSMCFYFVMLSLVGQVFADALMCGTEENWEQKGDKLIQNRYKLVETKEYPAPPEGLSVYTAAEIINGKEKSFPIVSKSITHYTRTWLFPVSKFSTSTTSAYFRKGKWETETSVVSTEEKVDIIILDFYILLFVLIVAVGIFNQKRRGGLKKLLLFYAVALFTIITILVFSGAVSWIMLLVVTIATAVAAIIAAGFKEEGLLASFIMAVLASGGAFMTKPDGTGAGFLATVALMCVISLLFALLTRRMVTKKEAKAEA